MQPETGAAGSQGKQFPRLPLCVVPSMDGRLVPPRAAPGLAAGAKVFLERVNQIRNKRHGHDYSGTYRRLQYFLANHLSNIPLCRRQHLAKSQREVEGGMGNCTEVRVGSRSVGRFVRHDREVDLFLLIHLPWRLSGLKSVQSPRPDSVRSKAEWAKLRVQVIGFGQEDRSLISTHDANHNTLNLNGLRRHYDRRHGSIGRL